MFAAFAGFAHPLGQLFAHYVIQVFAGFALAELVEYISLFFRQRSVSDDLNAKSLKLVNRGDAAVQHTAYQHYHHASYQSDLQVQVGAQGDRLVAHQGVVQSAQTAYCAGAGDAQFLLGFYHVHVNLLAYLETKK